MNDLPERRADQGAMMRLLGEVKGDIGEVKGEVSGMNTRLVKVERTVDGIKELADRGKGAGWMLFKFGAVVAAVVALAVLFWDRVTGFGA